MPRHLSDANINYLAGYSTVWFRDDSWSYQQRVKKFSRAALHLLNTRKANDGCPALPGYPELSFDTLLNALKEEHLPVEARLAIQGYVFSLPGASLRYRTFWCKFWAHRCHLTMVQKVGPVLAHLTRYYRDNPGELASRTTNATHYAMFRSNSGANMT